MTDRQRNDNNRDGVAGGEDAEIRESESAEKEAGKAARLFDVRRLIGGLFIVYGLLVGIAGIFDGKGASDKAAGIDINLWSGLAMLIFGVFMVGWQMVRPVVIEPGDLEEDGDDNGGGRPAH